MLPLATVYCIGKCNRLQRNRLLNDQKARKMFDRITIKHRTATAHCCCASDHKRLSPLIYITSFARLMFYDI